MITVEYITDMGDLSENIFGFDYEVFTFILPL